MDWQSAQKYISENVIELFVGVVIFGLITTFLWEFVKWIMSQIKECVRKQKLHESISANLKKLSQDQLQKQINSKKYLPDFYIEINQVKEGLRYFSHPFLFCNKFIDHINRRDFTYTNSVLNREIKRRIVFKDISKLSRSTLGALKVKIEELRAAVDRNSKVLNDMPEKSNDFPWRARWKMEEAIEKFNYLKSRVLVILDDAGQGKTNLICDLSREFLFKLGIPLALFFGVDFYGLSNNSMKSFVAEKITGVADFNSLYQFIDKECRQKKTNFIIIIDALNESSDENFPNALDEFIRDMLNNEFVRIILTCRTEYYNLNFKTIETSITSTYLNKIEGINSKLEEHEKDNLFRKYLSFFNIEWDLFSGRVYEKLVSNFLLLRIFCESYQGQKVGSVLNVYMLDLFQKYYRQIRDGIRGRCDGNASIEKVVCEVVRHMVDTKLYKDVPMQEIINNTGIDKNVLFALVDENIFFRRDIADRAGVLLDGEAVSFTFDEIRDYLISDYLVNIVLAKEELKAEKFIKEEVLPEKPLFEGVSKYLFFFAKKDRSSRKLLQILEKTTWYEDKYISYLFETNDDDLTSEDVNEIKSEYLSSGDKAEFILKMLIYCRYDPQTYKNLNITMLFSLLIELSDDERLDKFEKHFHDEHLSVAYGGRQAGINLDHYFEYIDDAMRRQDTNNPSIDFLFFIASSEKLGIRSKAHHALVSFYQKHPNIALEMLEKYKACDNNHFKERAISLINEFQGKVRGAQ